MTTRTTTGYPPFDRFLQHVGARVDAGEVTEQEYEEMAQVLVHAQACPACGATLRRQLEGGACDDAEAVRP